MNKTIGIQRLFSQRIAGEKFDTPEAVVKWMTAIQAQDYGQAIWAVGVRMHSATVTAVEQAIADGKIIRTWPMRGTIHFVPPEDAGWMLNLCASRLLGANKRRLQQLELTIETMEYCKDVFAEALHGGKRLTRPEMMQLLEDAGISTTGQRGYHILVYAAQSGQIYLGPMQGKQQTFGLLDDVAPNARELDHDEAVAELVERYFLSHGPATIQDFARWTGLTLTASRLGLEISKPKLTSIEIDGTEYWMGEGTDSVLPDNSVHLLPGFDEYMLGYKDRDAVLAAEHANGVVPGNNGIFFPMIVIDSRIIGTWKRKIKKKSLEITVDPFIPLGDLKEKVLEAAIPYSEFMQLPVSSIIVEEL